MKRKILCGLLYVSIAACGGKDTVPRPSTMEQLRVEVARIEAHVDPDLYVISGDSTLFSGLLSGIYPWACENLRASQFEDGSFARSPQHKSQGERDFSRDGAVGILWGVKSGCLDTLQSVGKWVNFINKHDGCLSTKCDAKADTSASFRSLIEKVTGQYVKWALPFPASWTPWGQHFFQEGSDEFLSYASMHLVGTTMAAQRPGSVFQNIVAGDKQRAADLLLPLMLAFREQECYREDCAYLRWSSQWPQEKWEAPRAEELIWLYHLVGGEKNGNGGRQGATLQ